MIFCRNRFFEDGGCQQQHENGYCGSDNGGIDRRRTFQPDDKQPLVDAHTAQGADEKCSQIFRQDFFFRHEEGHEPKHHAGENCPHDGNCFRWYVRGQQVFEYRHTDTEQDVCRQYLNISFHIPGYQRFVCIRSSTLIPFCLGRKAFSAGYPIVSRQVNS